LIFCHNLSTTLAWASDGDAIKPRSVSGINFQSYSDSLPRSFPYSFLLAKSSTFKTSTSSGLRNLTSIALRRKQDQFLLDKITQKQIQEKYEKMEILKSDLL
jgi:hypothetical protein